MATVQNLEMKQNPSVEDEGMGTTRLVTKSDGSKVPFSEDHLRSSINSQLEGLHRELINVNVIINKVTSGLYNGKSRSLYLHLIRSPVVALALYVLFWHKAVRIGHFYVNLNSVSLIFCLLIN